MTTQGAATTEKTRVVVEREWERDDRGLIIGHGKERFGITPIALTEDASNDMGRSISNRIPYLEGVRGLLGIQTLLWIFFRFFAPSIVTDTALDGSRPAPFVTESPEWMTIVRKVLSPLLFDGSLQMTCFIVLMGRVTLQTYMERRSATALAGECFRRPLRLTLPVALALALTSLVAVTNGFKHANWLSDRLHNDFLIPPQVWESTIVYFNSVVTLIMAPRTIRNSRAVMSIPPYGVMWFIVVAFQQTYTLTVVAWIVPYTIFKYKIMGGIFLVALTAWVASWAWYSITGLFICEFSILYRQLLPVDQTVSFHLPKMMDRTIRIPYKAGPIFLILLGTFLKYLWIAILPSKQDDEYVFHADINTAKLLRNNNPSVEAYPRYDNWFIAAGFFILLELSPLLRRCFSARPLVMLGRLSFSIILISGTVMMSLGSLVYQYLVEQANITNISTLTGIMFLIFIPLCLFFSFVWSIVVDQTSIKLSHLFFKFVKA